MRRWWTLTIALVLTGSPVAAQQGYVQAVSATQITTGDALRTGTTKTYEPDFGFSWFAPGTRFGTATLDVHAVRGDSDPRLGKALFNLHDLKLAGLKWTLDAGDTVHTPVLSEYGFANLMAPLVNFRGASISGSGPRTSFSMTAGRVTVFRDLFSANAETLGQSLFVARASHKPTDRIEIVAHASSVRTSDLGTFDFAFRSGDDAGAGVRVKLTSALQLIADAGMTSSRRKDSSAWEQHPSGLVGARWNAGRGWFQVDAHRLAPGTFSVLNNPYQDREGVYAAGEFELRKGLRAFGGVDLFRTDLAPTPAISDASPNGTSSRVYGGARVRVNSHLYVGTRIEQGARTLKPSRFSLGYESDTGTVAGDWQLTFKQWDATGRYERRSDVDVGAGRSTFTEHDASGQISFGLSSTTRAFGSLFLTRRLDPLGGSGQSFWQATTGVQVQVPGKNLFARGEVSLSRNHDVQTDFFTPRGAVSAGLNGQIAKHLALSLDVYLDHSPVQAAVAVNPWATRTIVRLVYMVPTGSPVAPGAPPRPRHGNEALDGLAFIDWNLNGVRDTDEPAAPGVCVFIDTDNWATSGPDGRFQVNHLAGGLHIVRLDLSKLPADFDPPGAAQIELKLGGARGNVSFGLVPLGDIEGAVVQQAEGSETSKPAVPVEGAVLVLDDGARTELTHDGRFRFSGVGPGTHVVKLLIESLPDDVSVVGTPQVQVELTRDSRTPTVGFRVKAEKRPEVRKTFPAKKLDLPAPGAAAPDTKSTVKGAGGKVGGTPPAKSPATPPAGAKGAVNGTAKAPAIAGKVDGPPK